MRREAFELGYHMRNVWMTMQVVTESEIQPEARKCDPYVRSKDFNL